MGAFHSTQNSRKFRLVHKMEWTVLRFGGTIEYSGLALKVVPYRPVQLSRLVGPKCPFPFVKIVVLVVLLFCILLTRTSTITKCTVAWAGSVQPECTSCSIGQVEFLKFQTGIFVEWKVPLIYCLASPSSQFKQVTGALSHSPFIFCAIYVNDYYPHVSFSLPLKFPFVFLRENYPMFGLKPRLYHIGKHDHYKKIN